MTDTMRHLLGLFAWVSLWGLGGIWLARAAFRLQPREQVVVGLAVGLLVENGLANWLVRWMPLPVGAWLSAGLVFIIGFGLAWQCGRLSFTIKPAQLLVLGGILWVMFRICRGMAIFDDYAHLPILSIMATGDVPPHFSFDPDVLYGYHHFLLLFSAQAMRVSGWASWTAYDFGRALSFGLAVMLAGLWTARLTRSQVAGVLGGVMLAFGSGGRWLLLLLPSQVITWLEKPVVLIGSGANSGATLSEAITQIWPVSGAGPFAFPFAFANGVLTAAVVSVHGSNGMMMYGVILLLLLTCNRWQAGRLPAWSAAVVSVIVFSAWGLLTEAELVILLVGWALVAAAALLRLSRAGGWSAWQRDWQVNGRLALPSSLWQWLAVIGSGTLLALFSGGAWTDLIFKTIQKMTYGVSVPSYQTVGFTLAEPAVVSSHLGVLWLRDPAQLLVALFEMGPLLLALPLLAVFGVRAFRHNRWYEAAQATAAVCSLAMVFVQFTGSTGVRNTPRLYVFMPLCLVFAVPLAWWWLAGRSQAVRAAVVGLGLAAISGGMVMFGVELLAGQRPVLSYFLTPLDNQMMTAHWNRLPPDALIFDPEPSRGTTVLGRFTNSSTTWFENKPAWKQLRAAPDPYALQAAGFDYLYLDQVYWESIELVYQQRLQAPCVKLVDEVTGMSDDFRRLYDLGACR